MAAWEKNLHLIIWISGISYSIYRVFLLGLRERIHLSNQDFGAGFFRDSEKDISDYEWQVWSPVILSLSVPYAIHFLIAYLLKNEKKVVPFCQILLSFATIWFTVGSRGFALLVVKAIATFLLSKTKSNWLIWTSCLVLLSVLRHERASEFLNIDDYVTWSIFSVTYAWCNMRSASFALDVANGAKASFGDFTRYYFYLPLFFMGPVVTFDEFMKKKDAKDLKLKALDFLQLLRYLFWYFVTEVSTYYMYISAIKLDVELVKRIGSWELCGLGYSMGQFFQLKYVFMYGYCGQFARLEGVNTPDPPVCVGHIHLYSKMWKYFDRGLHNFLVKYIYIPIAKLHPSVLNRFVASFICFAYVYYWHGIQDFVLVWSATNFLGVTIETAAKEFGKTAIYSRFRATLSDDGHRRFLGFVSVPLYAMSMVSNFYFFSCIDVGNIYVKKVLLNYEPVSFITLYLILYCGTQVSVHFDKVADDRKRR